MEINNHPNKIKRQIPEGICLFGAVVLNGFEKTNNQNFKLYMPTIVLFRFCFCIHNRHCAAKTNKTNCKE